MAHPKIKKILSSMLNLLKPKTKLTVPLKVHEEVVKERDMLKKDLEKANRKIKYLENELIHQKAANKIHNLQISRLMLYSPMPASEKKELEQEVNQLHTSLIFKYGRDNKTD